MTKTPQNPTIPTTAKLTIGDREIEFPVIQGTEGEIAVDIRKLRSELGIITYDPGLGNTGSCGSKVTFLNGEKGILDASQTTDFHSGPHPRSSRMSPAGSSRFISADPTSTASAIPRTSRTSAALS